MKYIILTFLLLNLSQARIVCANFDTHEEAQQYFDAQKKGYNGLDGDKDGEACECLKGGSGYDKSICKKWRKKYDKD